MSTLPISAIHKGSVRAVLFSSFAVLFMSACENLSWRRDSSTQSAVPTETMSHENSNEPAYFDEEQTDLLVYSNALLSLDPSRLSKEYERVRKRYGITGSASDRMRLVVLLLEPDAPFRDVGKARALLEDYLTDPESYDDGSEYHNIALFLLKFTDSAQQPGTPEGKLKRQLDSERLKRQMLTQQIQSLELELETIRAERKMLQEQVEALKNIEETLRTRDLSGNEQLKR